MADLDVVCEEFGVEETIARTGRLRLQIRRPVLQFEVFAGWNHCSALHRLDRRPGTALMFLRMVREQFVFE